VSVQRRVLVFGVGLAVLGMGVLGGAFVDRERRAYRADVTAHARTTLDVLASEWTPILAGNRVEELHDAVTAVSLRRADDLEFVAVVDRDRGVVAHSNPLLYGNTLDDLFTAEASESDDMLFQRVRGPQGPFLAVSRPLVTAVEGERGIRWGTLLARFSLAKGEQEFWELIFTTSALILLVTLLVGATIYTLLHRNLVRPVARLTEVAEEFARGNLAARSLLEGRDEIGKLGLTFNDMAERIQQHSRGLEREVNKATAELIAANERLSAMAQDLAEANRSLEDLATVDGMTGLRNYRYFQAFLDREVRRSLRTSSPVSVLMIDVDHFKHYNDTHGHPAGDDVLRQVSRVLKSRLRGIDLPCRYGGEEFAIVLLDTAKERAVRVAEEVRATIEQTPIANEETQPGGRLTISVGVATSLSDARTPDDLVKCADEALYEAKRTGRNRVVAWSL
jgi:diguanylate cyclase (GGDEF)-like protein